MAILQKISFLTSKDPTSNISWVSLELPLSIELRLSEPSKARMESAWRTMNFFTKCNSFQKFFRNFSEKRYFTVS
jgi:hypothetical protein